MRQVLQRTQEEKERGNKSRALVSFGSRLRWQAHFIQKFEMECSMEYKSINKGYHALVKGKTGRLSKGVGDRTNGNPDGRRSHALFGHDRLFEFQNASLGRIHLLSTSYGNLGKQFQDFWHDSFLDFEPGIHFPQIQMQAGETGINTLTNIQPSKEWTGA